MSAPDHNSQALSVEDPALRYIRWRRTGEIISVAQYIERMRYKHLVSVRGRLRGCWLKKRAIFDCPECGTPVYLACSPIHRGFFRHTKDSDDCPIKTRGSLSRDKITARMYGLRRESAEHRLMKEQIAECLELDHHFSDIVIEKIMTGTSREQGWRKPDVRAKRGPDQVVFEAQVNSTFIDIIQARRHFYASQNTALLWLMPKFDPRDRRLCQDDIMAQHRGTAFVVDRDTLEKSKADGLFTVKKFQFNDKTERWSEDYIPVHTLQFDFKTGGVYAPRKEDIHITQLRELGLQIGSELYGFHQEPSRQIWETFRRLGKDMGISLSEYGPTMEFKRLIRVMNSAMTGAPYGYGFKKLIEIPHNLEQCDRYALRTFMRVLEDAGNSNILEEQDSNGKWATKKKKIRKQWKLWTEGYLTTDDERAIVKLMFPNYAHHV